MPAGLYLDEQFGPPIAQALADRLRLRAERFAAYAAGGLDAEHLLRAAREGWAIVTRDHDFRQLHEFWYLLNLWRPEEPAQVHAGIIHISDRFTDRQMVEELPRLIGADFPQANQFVSLRPGGSAATEGVWAEFRPFAKSAYRLLSV